MPSGKLTFLKSQKSLLTRWRSSSKQLPLLSRNYLPKAPSLEHPNHCRRRLLRERVLNEKVWTQTSNSSQPSLRFVKSSARRFTIRKILIQLSVIAKERSRSQTTPAGEVGRNINSSNNAGRGRSPNLRRTELKSRQSESSSHKNRVDQSRRDLTLPNGLQVLARRQKTPRAKVPAPQNRQTLLS